jgi:2-polyprenyl-3-methyl-5-hydroxy-6-metoxy-1,4-benzoquinol methylase
MKVSENLNACHRACVVLYWTVRLCRVDRLNQACRQNARDEKDAVDVGCGVGGLEGVHFGSFES